MRRWPILLLTVAGLIGQHGAAWGELPSQLDAGPSYNGAPCGSDHGCDSGFCVDGVCCNTRCLGACMQCDRDGLLGICAPAALETDPRGLCPGSGPCRARCDGSGRCAWPGEDVACVEAACVAGLSVLLRGSRCDGRGACVDQGAQDCAPFQCRAGHCPVTCATAGDCALGATCLEGSCGAPRSLGAPCASAGHCASGYCAHEVCCERECGGSCERCDAPGPTGTVDGTCRVMAGRVVPGACPGQGLCTGACDEQGECAWPGPGVACDVCVACDGAGACAPLPASKDDDRCGNMECGALGWACVVLEAGPRCLAPGVCATPRTGSVCNRAVTVADGTACYSSAGGSGLCAGGVCEPVIPDGGLPRDAAPPPDSLSDRDDRRAAICGCATGARPGAGLALAGLLAVTALAGRRRREAARGAKPGGRRAVEGR